MSIDNTNRNGLKPGDVVQFSNRHKGAKSLLEYSNTIVKCCPKKVFYHIREDRKRVFCSYWHEYNTQFEDMRGRVLAEGELPAHYPPSYEVCPEYYNNPTIRAEIEEKVNVPTEEFWLEWPKGLGLDRLLRAIADKGKSCSELYTLADRTEQHTEDRSISYPWLMSVRNFDGTTGTKAVNLKPGGVSIPNGNYECILKTPQEIEERMFKELHLGKYQQTEEPFINPEAFPVFPLKCKNGGPIPIHEGNANPYLPDEFRLQLEELERQGYTVDNSTPPAVDIQKTEEGYKATSILKLLPPDNANS